ncbi:hypothetical protein F1737_08015 [Methanoplanus sp. FWC-SCC4]|uniref:Uncharacterized protein n=1 Tax=Methanochimaera problematica TaxID=2609417 RepID=A0AA97FDP3_9EURY|nr:hypothetical protein [Methanoplanus sp. FWC-SCC4]WOF16637.1 hypothetical protein F1737_08015 [Methanoplanus sp. FWC-SCC4]
MMMKKIFYGLLIFALLCEFIIPVGATTLYRINTEYPSTEVEGLSLTGFIITGEKSDLYIGDTISVKSIFKNTLPQAKGNTITLSENWGSYFVVSYSPAIIQADALADNGEGTVLYPGQSFTNTMDYVIESTGTLSVHPQISTDKGSVSASSDSGIPFAFLKVTAPAKTVPEDDAPANDPTEKPKEETPIPTDNPTEKPKEETPIPTDNPTEKPEEDTPVPTDNPTEKPEEVPQSSITSGETDDEPALPVLIKKVSDESNGVSKLENTTDLPIFVWILLFVAVIATAAITYTVTIQKQKKKD